MISQAEDRLLRIKEVAEILSVSSRTVYRMIQDGQLPEPIKIRSRCSAIPKSAIDKLIKCNGGK